MRIIDPADAGMDNPPEPVPEYYRRDHLEALQQRVEELEQMVATLLAAKRIVGAEAEARERVLREALERIEKAPAWGAPDRWETTPFEVRQLARAALSAHKEAAE
jgi:hypothetical protein